MKRFSRTGNYRTRLNAVIPGGAHTYSRGHDQFPSNAPQILARGKGAYVWDPSGRSFLDYGMGLRSVTLGYAHPEVDAGAIRQIRNGVNLTRPSTIELEAAELMVHLIPSAEMVKFAKHGSTVTTAAVKLARAATGRTYVCVPREHPFFSFDDWFIGSTVLTRGIPPAHRSSTLVFNYNNIASLQRFFDEHPGDIAAVIMEPATTIDPCPARCCTSRTIGKTCTNCPNHSRNFLHQVRELCDKYGTVFILDEMITGFRWHLQGAQTYFGVTPDLSTFGKGMANGYALAALVGKREIMKCGSIDEPGMERTFLVSTTHGAEMSALGAFVAALEVYRERHVIDHIWAYGARLFEQFNEVCRSEGLQDYVGMEGNFVAMNYVTRDENQKPSLSFRTLFAQELVKQGVLMPWVAVSLAHRRRELARTIEGVAAALRVYRKALENGVKHYLKGPAIQPVFRKFN